MKNKSKSTGILAIAGLVLMLTGCVPPAKPQPVFHSPVSAETSARDKLLHDTLTRGKAMEDRGDYGGALTLYMTTTFHEDVHDYLFSETRGPMERAMEKAPDAVTRIITAVCSQPHLSMHEIGLASEKLPPAARLAALKGVLECTLAAQSRHSEGTWLEKQDTIISSLKDLLEKNGSVVEEMRLLVPHLKLAAVFLGRDNSYISLWVLLGRLSQKALLEAAVPMLNRGDVDYIGMALQALQWNVGKDAVVVEAPVIERLIALLKIELVNVQMTDSFEWQKQKNQFMSHLQDTLRTVLLLYGNPAVHIPALMATGDNGSYAVYNILRALIYQYGSFEVSAERTRQWVEPLTQALLANPSSLPDLLGGLDKPPKGLDAVRWIMEGSCVPPSTWSEDEKAKLRLAREKAETATGVKVVCKRAR